VKRIDNAKGAHSRYLARVGGNMSSLQEVLGGAKRQAVVRDACGVLDQEVADKGGLSGIAIKAAYSLVKGIKPGFIEEVVDGLLDDFLRALDPLYQEALKKGVRPGAHLKANGDAMAEALLAITDARAQRATRVVLQKTYEKLRPTAKKHVASASPRVGELLDRHV
jgi:hypothetical protein